MNTTNLEGYPRSRRNGPPLTPGHVIGFFFASSRDHGQLGHAPVTIGT
jgi:hypothetical protein